LSLYGDQFYDDRYLLALIIPNKTGRLPLIDVIVEFKTPNTEAAFLVRSMFTNTCHVQVIFFRNYVK